MAQQTQNGIGMGKINLYKLKYTVVYCSGNDLQPSF